MYCPTCGVSLVAALSYCNHCGASLNSLQAQDKRDTAEEAIDTLVLVNVGTSITLLGMALGALVLIKQGAIDEKMGRTFVILSFVAFFVLEAIMLWRLVSVNRNKRSEATRAQLQSKDLSTEELTEAPARALLEPREPLSSITEETTRVFEPSYRKSEPR